MDKPKCGCGAAKRCDDKRDCCLAKASQNRTDGRVKKVCPYFLNASCKFGKYCWYDHPDLAKSVDSSQKETSAQNQLDNRQNETTPQSIDSHPRLLVRDMPEEYIPYEITFSPRDRIITNMGHHYQCSKISSECYFSCGDRCRNTVQRSERNLLVVDNFKTSHQKGQKSCDGVNRLENCDDKFEKNSDFHEAFGFVHSQNPVRPSEITTLQKGQKFYDGANRLENCDEKVEKISNFQGAFGGINFPNPVRSSEIMSFQKRQIFYDRANRLENCDDNFLAFGGLDFPNRVRSCEITPKQTSSNASYMIEDEREISDRLLTIDFPSTNSEYDNTRTLTQGVKPGKSKERDHGQDSDILCFVTNCQNTPTDCTVAVVLPPINKEIYNTCALAEMHSLKNKKRRYSDTTCGEVLGNLSSATKYAFSDTEKCHGHASAPLLAQPQYLPTNCNSERSNVTSLSECCICSGQHSRNDKMIHETCSYSHATNPLPSMELFQTAFLVGSQRKPSYYKPGWFLNRIEAGPSHVASNCSIANTKTVSSGYSSKAFILPNLLGDDIPCDKVRCYPYTSTNYVKKNAEVSSISKEVCDKCYIEYLIINNVVSQSLARLGESIMKKICCICLEDVYSKSDRADRWFGILRNCKHSYCLKCIRQWQKTKNFRLTPCPVCRALSSLIIPSEIWVEDDNEKTELIENYFTSKMKIRCGHVLYKRRLFLNLSSSNCVSN
ncbi:uncharacterized protein LOC118181748 [Stegodyphus dumicola]|uniref:uncharacterized protein LOC118181748 n=1 Tax=Stegodyphus dumicola TaxID=202533 RepID=UPI0015AB763F|nr:uncharacterized protein LOC118181748 [Stegodyphus dumicola]